jgi:hypothetical protein
MQKIHCHICYSLDIDEDFICDRCEEYYCEDCSYTFTIHYQYEGSLCYYCSDQKRRKPLTKELKRHLKIKYLESLNENSI